MTDREINEAIAEACGWRKCNCAAGCLAWYEPGDNSGNRPHVCPGFNYVGDLNQIHEAEKTLTREQQDTYSANLFSLLPEDENLGPIIDGVEDVLMPSQFQVAHATARQRCEAFLRVLGKWKEAAK